ncbi:MAG: hypothetical protein ACI8T1_002438 [Verrucomicrobiales bacterium]|jgi:hypothetical protein
MKVLCLLILLLPCSLAAEEPISFVDDILPVMNKAGCSGSSCHSKPAGQNGFKLSVFAYDPESDYAEIVNDGRGRRVSPGSPEQSLILLKATQSVPHEGGKRFELDSQAYEVIAQWIREGAPYKHADDAPLSEISLIPDTLPAERGAEVPFRVTARYENGKERDVTALAAFESNKEAIVEIDSNGNAVAGNLFGEAIIVARFLGEVATARVTIAPEKSASFADIVPANFIDTLAYARLKQLGLQPSGECSDHEFLRRSSIDLIGLLPDPESTRAFLADQNPDKREAWVARLLENPHFADHWAVKWADLLRPNPDRVGVKSVYVLDQWIRDAFRQNKPLDQFAREILTAQGSTHRHGPTVIYRDRRTPEDLTSMISQVLMGVRLECARCHHHPNEKWSQEDYYQMAAFFAKMKRKGTGLSPPISGSWEFVYHGTGGEVKHPVTQVVMTPKPPDGPLVEKLVDTEDPRVSLAEWLIDPSNPFFAKAMVNRVWGEVMGRGIVHPVDDFRATNPPTNPALLEALAEDFVSHGFDLKHLLKRIALSNLYQQSSEPTESNLHDTENFSRSYRRRMPAEVLGNALTDITQVPDLFEGLPQASRASQVWNFKIASDTLDAFGRPDSSSDCPCERNLSTSVVQALHLMNSEALQTKLNHADGRVKALASSERAEPEIIEELYLNVYQRFPEPEERQIALAVFNDKETDRQTATEDLLWALLNSAEFLFNH